MSHTIWYFDRKTGRSESVACSDKDVADMLWDRLEKAGHRMQNLRPNYNPKRRYTGLKDGSKAWPRPEAPITQDDLEEWKPE
jgi:hypothetical protein